MSRSTLWRVLAVTLPVLGALVAPLPAVDLAYQLRAGGEILDTGAIPSLDTWTFTAAGAPWLDQQWGAQVLLTVVFRLGGWTGLALLRAGLVGLAFGLLLLAIRHRAPRLGPRAAALLVIGAFVVSASALALRPQLLAIDLFAATLLILAIRADRPRAVWLIPVLAVAWANVHGTFLLGPALCGLAWLGDLADTPPGRGGSLRRHRLLLVGAVATVATVVTPFGPAVWGYVADLASNPTIAGRVSEWQPPSPLTASGALVWLSLVGVAAATIVRIRRGWRGPGAVPWPALVTLLAFGGFAAVSGRGTAWWPFVAAFVVAPWLPGSVPGAEHQAVAARPTPAALRRLNLAIVAVLALAGVALLPMWRPALDRWPPDGVLTYAPELVAQALATLPHTPGEPPRPRVWNPQAWGSWLEFAAPGYAYALDSRIELFPPSIWDQADAVAAGDLAILDRYDVSLVVTDRQADARLEAALEAAPDVWFEAVGDCEASVWFRAAVLPRVAAPVGCPPRGPQLLGPPEPSGR
jgi:hypothetical protein